MLLKYILDPEIPFDTEIAVWHAANLTGADLVQLTSWSSFWPAKTNCVGFGFGNFGSGSFGTGGEFRRFVVSGEKGFGFGPDSWGFGYGRFGLYTVINEINVGYMANGEHCFKFKLRDQAGNISDWASELITTTVDNIPDPPSNAAFVSSSTTDLTLTWNLSTSL